MLPNGMISNPGATDALARNLVLNAGGVNIPYQITSTGTNTFQIIATPG